MDENLRGPSSTTWMSPMCSHLLDVEIIRKTMVLACLAQQSKLEGVKKENFTPSSCHFIPWNKEYYGMGKLNCLIETIAASKSSHVDIGKGHSWKWEVGTTNTQWKSFNFIQNTFTNFKKKKRCSYFPSLLGAVEVLFAPMPSLEVLDGHQQQAQRKWPLLRLW